MKTFDMVKLLVIVILGTVIFFNFDSMVSSFKFDLKSTTNPEEVKALEQVALAQANFADKHTSKSYLSADYVDKVMSEMEGVVVVNRQPLSLTRGAKFPVTTDDFDAIQFTLSFSNVKKLLTEIDGRKLYVEALTINSDGSVANVTVRVKEVTK